MAEQTVLVAIDIGTTKVCVLIGETESRGGVDVIGIGQAASDGLRKGVVIDIDRTVQSVASAVDAAERLSGLKVRSAFVGISGSHVSSQNSRGMIAVSGSRHDVDRDDTVRAIDAADRKSTRLNSSHTVISYAVFCLKKQNTPAKE